MAEARDESMSLAAAARAPGCRLDSSSLSPNGEDRNVSAVAADFSCLCCMASVL